MQTNQIGTGIIDSRLVADNLWWVVPLVAVGLLYLLYRALRKSEYEKYRRLTGSKGGRAQRLGPDEWI